MYNIKKNKPLNQIIQNSITTRKVLPFYDLSRGITRLFRGIIHSCFGSFRLFRRNILSLGLQEGWAIAFAKASNKQNRTSADVQGKDDARISYVKELRGFVAQWLASSNKVSNSDRERMGLTVKTGSRTPVPVPLTLPMGNIDFSIRLQHTISYYDEATPRSKAKPSGVHGCEIWMKIDGNAPTDASELSYVATDTNSPYTTPFEGKHAGKIVFYWLRWVNTRGERGPWSSTISAIVAG
ncbi:MAG: hypothetical protein Q8T08_06510 [Ignavibacteria bacterium]|nr:hypothetical protein [Ignavibacteria bacterium]